MIIVEDQILNVSDVKLLVMMKIGKKIFMKQFVFIVKMTRMKAANLHLLVCKEPRELI